MRLALLCSTRCPGTIIVHSLDVAVGLRNASAIVASGFQSPVEKETLRVLLKGTINLVMCPARSAVGIRIPAAWKKPMADGRLAIRSFVDEAMSAKSGTTAKPTQGPRRPTIDLAEQRNRFVASISDAILILHASPGGKLDRLADELLAAGKSLWTLDDPSNGHLLNRGTHALRPDSLPREWTTDLTVVNEPRRPSPRGIERVLSRIRDTARRT